MTEPIAGARRRPSATVAGSSERPRPDVVIRVTRREDVRRVLAL